MTKHLILACAVAWLAAACGQTPADESARVANGAAGEGLSIELPPEQAEAAPPAPPEEAKKPAPAEPSKPESAEADEKKKDEKKKDEKKKEEVEETAAKKADEPAKERSAAAGDRPPISDGAIASTIRRIGFPCESVVSASRVEGGADRTYRISCAGGPVYRGTSKEGRLRFRPWEAQ